jgi:amino acid transporter
MIAGYLHWVSGATDNAIYPSLFLHYLVSSTYDEPLSDMLRFIFTSLMTIILAWINYRGLEIVGQMSIIVCIVSMSPFVVMCLIGMFRIDPSRWFQLPPADLSIVRSSDTSFQDSGFFPSPVWGSVLWRPLLNNLFWNLNQFDAAGSFAGEIADPGRVFPRAVGLSVALVVLGYLLPLLVALGATETHQMDWSEGYLAIVATKIGGSWLGAWTVFAAGISNLALFEAEMSRDAFQLMGMANRGLFPKIFSTQSKYDTPTYGILLGTFFVIAMSVADFAALVEMLNFAYSLALLIEFAAFIKLRISHADGMYYIGIVQRK